MTSATLTIPLLLAITAGCSTSVVGRSVASLPGPDAGRGSSTRPAAEASNPMSCVVTGEARIIAPKARVRSGVELAVNADKLLLGFATEPSEGVAMELDPSSGAPLSRSSYRSDGPITHLGSVVAALADGAIEAACQVDRFENPTTLTADRTFVMGTSHGQLAWAACAGGPIHALWPVPGGTADELQGVALGEGRGFAIVFRNEQSVWFGKLDGSMSPMGALSKVAERPSIRWPALAPIDGGHFLFAWTEGSVAANEVRAVTLDSHGAPFGSPIPASSGRDGGWTRLAVTSDGHGAIAFLTPTESGFAVATTPVSCPVPPPRGEALLLGAPR